MPEEGEITSERLFGDDRPLHLEIGFGGGEHLAYRADLLPDHGFIGCEPFLNGVAPDARPYPRRSGSPMSASTWAMRSTCCAACRTESLTMVYLLHPDPWPKARHAKRRMMNDGPLALIAAKMKPGGEFRVATDDPTYLNWSLMVMQRHARPVRMGGEGAGRMAALSVGLARDALRRQGAPRGPYPAPVPVSQN